jgi:hypothetical protein
MAIPFSSSRKRKVPRCPVVGVIFVVDDAGMPHEQLGPPKIVHHSPLVGG